MTVVPEELLMRFLDGELSDDEREKLVRRIEEDSENRSLLQFEHRVRELLSERAWPGSSRVPRQFTDRVMRTIGERARANAIPGKGLESGKRLAPKGRSGRGRGWAARFGRELLRPRTIVFKPAHALAGAAGLAALAALAFALSGIPAGVDRPVSGEIAAAEGLPANVDAGRGAGQAVEGLLGEDTVLVRFIYEDETARSVAVAGDFTRWEPISLEKRRRDGRAIWSGVVAVPRGEHRYMFVVDGSDWVTDPLATAVGDDGFGNRNAILSL